MLRTNCEPLTGVGNFLTTGIAKNIPRRKPAARFGAGNLVLCLCLLLIAPCGSRAADSSTIGPFALELPAPQMLRPAADFPYLWVLRDGSALLEVSKGNRTYRRPGGFEYVQQDPEFLVSRDGLKTWQTWGEAKNVAELPWFEGAVVQLQDGSVLMFE